MRTGRHPGGLGLARARPTRPPATVPSSRVSHSCAQDSAAAAAPSRGANRTSRKPKPPRARISHTSRVQPASNRRPGCGSHCDPEVAAKNDRQQRCRQSSPTRRPGLAVAVTSSCVRRSRPAVPPRSPAQTTAGCAYRGKLSQLRADCYARQHTATDQKRVLPSSAVERTCRLRPPAQGVSAALAAPRNAAAICDRDRRWQGCHRRIARSPGDPSDFIRQPSGSAAAAGRCSSLRAAAVNRIVSSKEQVSAPAAAQPARERRRVPARQSEDRPNPRNAQAL